MAKGNKKATKTSKDMLLDKGFDQLAVSLDNMVEGIKESMPLLAESLKLSKSIVLEYKKSAKIAREQNAK